MTKDDKGIRASRVYDAVTIILNKMYNEYIQG